MSKPFIPEVTWAQRSSAHEAEKNIIYLTINCPDVSPESLKLDLQPTKLSFAGTNKHNTHYAVELEFYEEIDVEHSKSYSNPRGVEYVLRKKNTKVEYWPRLLKDTKKVHFLKTDFDKWIDEDEQEENENDLYKDMGYDDPSFGGLDFSKLGGGGDLSSIPQSSGHDSDDDVEDDEMPELEDTDITKKEPEVEDEAKSAEEKSAEAPKKEGQGEEKKPLIEEIQ